MLNMFSREPRVQLARLQPQEIIDLEHSEVNCNRLQCLHSAAYTALSCSVTCLLNSAIFVNLLSRLEAPALAVRMLRRRSAQSLIYHVPHAEKLPLWQMFLRVVQLQNSCISAAIVSICSEFATKVLYFRNPALTQNNLCHLFAWMVTYMRTWTHAKNYY